jgi:hypothetical protein
MAAPPPSPLPPPSQPTERYLLAETLNDLKRVVDLLVNEDPRLIEGSAREEIQEAWNTEAKGRMESLIQSLANPGTRPVVTDTQLIDNGLFGSKGKAQRVLFRTLRDGFLNAFRKEPRTLVDTERAAELGTRAVEVGGHIVSSIPGHHYVVEFLGLTKVAVQAGGRLFRS